MLLHRPGIARMVESTFYSLMFLNLWGRSVGIQAKCNPLINRSAFKTCSCIIASDMTDCVFPMYSDCIDYGHPSHLLWGRSVGVRVWSVRRRRSGRRYYCVGYIWKDNFALLRSDSSHRNLEVGRSGFHGLDIGVELSSLFYVVRHVIVLSRWRRCRQGLAKSGKFIHFLSNLNFFLPVLS